MAWKEFSEMIYYVLLKRGQILIAVLGMIVGILVYMNAQKYGIFVNAVSNEVITTCDFDNDCFEHCEKCVSVASQKSCTQDITIACACINKTCTKIT